MVGSTTILKFTYHDYLDEVFQRQMYESALRDGLTKVFNKKYFTDYLEKEFAYAARHSSPLALIFLDIDFFKRINDTHGHPAGDFVLSELSQLMATLVRTEDVLARFGGEEFTVLCRGTDLGGAKIVAERLRRTVEAHTFSFGAKTIPVTISLGIAAIPDTAIVDHAQFLAASDKALYEAKRTGRNRVCLHGTETTPKPAKRNTGSGPSGSGS
jgi:diguanylate cyclase (GGDEF)-like protein